ncbi:MAG: Gfo/Idh/MocA family oxidoreductase [bacterium]
MKTKKVRLGLIGAGGMGNAHLGNLPKIKNVELTAVCDIVKEKAVQTAATHKCASFVDHKELLKAKMCDAVLIATPHYGHTTIGIDALKAGLHVLVEKPISVHKADCERLIAAHQKKGQVFAAMFNQRTDPHYRKIKQMLERGDLGKLDRITWVITNWFRTESYYASGGWRATWAGEGGGVLLNQCPHNLDLWQWLFGMPDTVRGFCSIGRKHDIEVEDEVTAHLGYQNGCTGVFITSTGEAPGVNRLEIAGEHGRLTLENGDLRFIRNEVSAIDFLRDSPEAFSSPAVWDIQIPINGYGGQHLEVLQNFIDAIVDRAPLIAPAREGINSVELGNAMLYSSETGKTVAMPLNAKAYEAMLKNKIKNSRFVKKTRVVAHQDLSQSVKQ